MTKTRGLHSAAEYVLSMQGTLNRKTRSSSCGTEASCGAHVGAQSGRNSEAYRVDGHVFRGIHASEQEGPRSKRCRPETLGQHFITIMVVANAVFLGVATGEQEPWMVAAEHIFTATFAAEMVARLFSMGIHAYFTDGFNCMDFVLAWLAIIENWVLAYVYNVPDLGDFNVLRIFRLLRVVRLIKVVKLKHELGIILQSLVGAMKAMCWIMILLMLLLYSLALILMALIDYDAYEGTDLDPQAAFGSLPRAMLTLFGVLIVDNFGDVAWPMYERQAYLIPLMVLFLTLTAFGMLNVVVGVVTEKALTTRHKLREEEHEEDRRSRMRRIVGIADTIYEEHDELSADGLVDAMVESHAMMEEIQDLQLPRGFMLHDLNLLFDRQSSTTLSKAEFINGMVRLVFSSDFQRDCCLRLALAHIRSEFNFGLEELREAIVASSPARHKEFLASYASGEGAEKLLQSSDQLSRGVGALRERTTESPWLEELKVRATTVLKGRHVAWTQQLHDVLHANSETLSLVVASMAVEHAATSLPSTLPLSANLDIIRIHQAYVNNHTSGDMSSQTQMAQFGSKVEGASPVGSLTHLSPRWLPAASADCEWPAIVDL